MDISPDNMYMYRGEWGFTRNYFKFSWGHTRPYESLVCVCVCVCVCVSNITICYSFFISSNQLLSPCSCAGVSFAVLGNCPAVGIDLQSKMKCTPPITILIYIKQAMTYSICKTCKHAALRDILTPPLYESLVCVCVCVCMCVCVCACVCVRVV